MAPTKSSTAHAEEPARKKARTVTGSKGTPSNATSVFPKPKPTDPSSAPVELPSLPFAPVPCEATSSAFPQVASSFSSLVTLIPTRYYLPRPESAIAPPASTSQPNAKTKQSQPKRNQQAAAAAKKQAAKSARKAKLDPANHKSVEEVAAERLAEGSSWADRLATDHSDDESENESLPFAVDDGDEEATMNNDDSYSHKRKRSDDDDATTDTTVRPTGPTQAGASIGDLRARLQSRIANLRRSRRGVPDEPGGSDESTTGSVADLLAERRRRGEMRDRRRRERKEARRAAAVTAVAAAASASPSPGLGARSSPSLVGRSPVPSGFKHPGMAEPSSSLASPRSSVSTLALDAPRPEDKPERYSPVRYSPQIDMYPEAKEPRGSSSSPTKPEQSVPSAQNSEAERIVDHRQEVLKHSPPPPVSSSLPDAKATSTPATQAPQPSAPTSEAQPQPQPPGQSSTEHSRPVAEGQPAHQKRDHSAHHKGAKRGRKPHSNYHKTSSSSSRPGGASKAKAARPGFEGNASAFRARAMARKGKKGAK